MTIPSCCICEKPNNYDEGTACRNGKLICKECRKDLAFQ